MRKSLLAGMGIMMTLLVATVWLGSPTPAPIVQPCMDIEAIWALEDERQESDGPMVVHLENNGAIVAYDSGKNTFYCTLGLNNGDEWPQIRLTAPDDRGLNLCFADDYTQDSCADAIRDGTVYSVFAYDDEQYGYCDLVFTGLPQIRLLGDGVYDQYDLPLIVTVSAEGRVLESDARGHRRGAASFYEEKTGYRVEFTRGPNGKKKIAQDVPGMGLMDTLLIVPCNADETLIRDRLSWDVYAAMSTENMAFTPRKTMYTELFVNGDYRGLYLVLEPFDIAEELRRESVNSVLTDYVYRVSYTPLVRGNQLLAHPRRNNAGFEWYYSPDGVENFDALSDYLDLITETDDEAFVKKAAACLDLPSMIRMGVLIQAGAMPDNIFNNLYIRAKWNGSRYVYGFAPWDMDATWGLRTNEIGEDFENWMFFPTLDRLLKLDALGTREMFAKQWKSLRESVLNTEWLEERITSYSQQIRRSGAYERSAARWETAEMYDENDIIAFATERMKIVDEAVQKIGGGTQAF